MGDWYKFVIPKKPEEELFRDLLDDIPGVKLVSNGDVWAPENCAWLLSESLNSMGIAFTTTMAKRQSPNVTYDLSAGRFAIERLENEGKLKKGVAEWLFAHQVDAVQHAVPRDGSVLLHPCGVGKSAAAIVASLFHPGLTLVVTIASVRRQFGRAVDQYTTGRSKVIVPGPKARNTFDDINEDVRNGATHVVVGWEALASNIEILRKLKPKKLIMDEIHKAKAKSRYSMTLGANGEKNFSKKQNLTASAMELSRMVNWRLGLTATFIPNCTEDAWAQLDLLEPGQWGSFLRHPKEDENRRFSGFGSRFCDAKKSQWGNIDTKGSSHLDELAQRMSFLAHVVDKAAAMKDVPPARREVVYISSDEQTKATGFEKEIKEALQKGGTFLSEVLRAEAAARKRKWIIDRIQSPLESGQKVVVLTGRHKDCNKLHETCLKEFGDIPKISILNGVGSISPSGRERIKDDYVAHDGPTLLVGTREAWSTGVDGLQCTDLVINAMLPWTLKDVEQSEGRFTRLGGMKNVILVYPICENTFDERVADVLLKKLPAVAALNGSDLAAEFGRDLKGADQNLMDSLFAKILESIPSKHPKEDD